jgi:hypothetical protein
MTELESANDPDPPVADVIPVPESGIFVDDTPGE